MEDDQDLESPKVRLLQKNRSHISNDRERCVAVDSAVNLPLQLSTGIAASSLRCDPIDAYVSSPYVPDADAPGGSRTIPFVDDDEDRAPMFSPVLDEHEENVCDAKCNSLICPTATASITSNDSSVAVSKNYADSNCVYADLDDGSLHNDRCEEELEYGELQDLQRRVPQVQNYRPDLLEPSHLADLVRRENTQQEITQDNGYDADMMYNSIMERPSFADLMRQRDMKQNNGYEPKQLCGDTRMNSLVESDKRGRELFVTRNGKLVRRKNRDDKSVIRSEQMDGYRGNEELENILAYIEGVPPEKKTSDEQRKKSKKKTAATGEHGAQPQKKEKATEGSNTMEQMLAMSSAASSEKETSPNAETLFTAVPEHPPSAPFVRFADSNSKETGPAVNPAASANSQRPRSEPVLEFVGMAAAQMSGKDTIAAVPEQPIAKAVVQSTPAHVSRTEPSETMGTLVVQERASGEPVVQFVGMAASHPSSSEKLTFFFEDCKSGVNNSLMTRSAVTLKNNQIKASMAVAQKPVKEIQCNSKQSVRNMNKRDAKLDKIVQDMADFADKAWADFTSGMGEVTVYVPEKNN